MLSLQMILERRTNQGMLRLIQPKDTYCISSREKPSVKDSEERPHVTMNGDDNSDKDEKLQHDKNEEKNPVSLKHGPVNVPSQPSVEKTSPLESPGLRKTTYNPITHATSMFENAHGFGEIICLKYNHCSFV